MTNEILYEAQKKQQAVERAKSCIQRFESFQSQQRHEHRPYHLIEAFDGLTADQQRMILITMQAYLRYNLAQREKEFRDA